MKLFNHVQVKVSNLKKSRSFYDALMNVLGYSVVLDIDGTVVGYGTSVHDMFEISQTTTERPLSRAVHLAFNAPSLQAVDEFYQVALQRGGVGNGEPGFREYEKGYYAAFIIDPDGHNIEAVYMHDDLQ